MPSLPKPFPFSQDYVRERLKYDKTTGIFTWRYNSNAPQQWNTRYAGIVAGTPHNHGYILIRLDGKPYLAHRLAWFYVYGEQPDEVDHRDTIKSHNWLDNLRPATTSQNALNRSAQSNNTSGYKGVSKKRNRWQAQLRVRGNSIFLGTYDTPEEASKAYIDGAKRYAKHFARWNTVSPKRKPMPAMILKGSSYAH